MVRAAPVSGRAWNEPGDGMTPTRTSAMALGICLLGAAVLASTGFSRAGGYVSAMASAQTLTVTPQADAYVSAAAPTTKRSLGSVRGAAR